MKKINNKQGFTLMELLLTVFILIIVAATMMPTFFGGGREVLNETRKNSMLMAYQNTLSGTQLMLAIAYNKATKLIGDLDKEQESMENKLLSFYAPMAARSFSLEKKTYTFGAKMNEAGDGVVVYYSEGPTYSPENSQRVGLGDADLKALWETLLAKENE